MSLEEQLAARFGKTICLGSFHTKEYARDKHNLGHSTPYRCSRRHSAAVTLEQPPLQSLRMSAPFLFLGTARQPARREERPVRLGRPTPRSFQRERFRHRISTA